MGLDEKIERESSKLVSNATLEENEVVEHNTANEMLGLSNHVSVLNPPSVIYLDTKFLLFVISFFKEYICSLWIYFNLLPSESYELTTVLVLMEIGVWLWSRKP